MIPTSTNRCEPAMDLSQALQAVQKVLVANPHSVFAHILAGELFEAQGDFLRASAAYEAALSEFYCQHPDGPAPPLLLLQRSAKLKLRAQL
jgi:tetratricopeptide (TPR) repeat protein